MWRAQPAEKITHPQRETALSFFDGCIFGVWWRHNALYGMHVRGGGGGEMIVVNKQILKEGRNLNYVPVPTKRSYFHVSHIEYIEQLSKHVFQK